MSSRTVQGTFLGIDRVDFARVAFWRRDFAPGPLGALMNALAQAPDGILASRDFMKEYALKVGDTVRVQHRQLRSHRDWTSRLSASSISSQPGTRRTARCSSATWIITSSRPAARCPTAYG